MDHETIEGVEVFAAGDHRGEVVTAADLAHMAAAARQVGFRPPITFEAEPGVATAAGYATNVRVAGRRLLADLVAVPRALTDIIRHGRFRRIGAEIYQNFTTPGRTWGKVLKRVRLIGGPVPPSGALPAVAVCAAGDAMDVRCYTLTFPIPSASCAEDPTMEMNYADLPVEDQCYVTRQMVDGRARRYMQTHAGTSYTEALAVTLRADPLLKERYASSWLSLPVGDAPSDEEEEAAAQRRKAAGEEVLSRARTWLAKHANRDATIEEAVRLVVTADSQLARAYLGMP
jgi:hypothetical protein